MHTVRNRTWLCFVALLPPYLGIQALLLGCLFLCRLRLIKSLKSIPPLNSSVRIVVRQYLILHQGVYLENRTTGLSCVTFRECEVFSSVIADLMREWSAIPAGV